MQLKNHQRKALDQLAHCLEELKKARLENKKAAEAFSPVSLDREMPGRTATVFLESLGFEHGG